MSVYNYVDFRCIDPVASQVGQPWYRISDVCPCSPSQSFPTGRGFTSCPFGVQFDDNRPQKNSSELMAVQNIDNKWASVPDTNAQKLINNGSMFPVAGSGSLTGTEPGAYTPPMLQPRQLARIGYTYRY